MNPAAAVIIANKASMEGEEPQEPPRKRGAKKGQLLRGGRGTHDTSGRAKIRRTRRPAVARMMLSLQGQYLQVDPWLLLAIQMQPHEDHTPANYSNPYAASRMRT